MKTSYLLFTAIALAFFAQPDPTHPPHEHPHPVCLHSKNHAPAYLYIHSFEENDQDGDFTVQAVIRAEDTNYLLPDSLEIPDSSIFQIMLSQPELINAELSDFCKKIEKRRYI